jgi:N-succinyldiaminopimelate aminotransferase
MNPALLNLQPYPFERLRSLTQHINPNSAYSPISLGIGEPKHATPELITEALKQAVAGLSNYPATAGLIQLRETCANWVQRRYGVALNPQTQLLPVNGSREALFSFAQTVIDPHQSHPMVVCPNPFYQIYEGAAVLAGAKIYFVNSPSSHNFAPDWHSVPPEVWQKTQLLYVCSPGNPTGAVMPLAEWQYLFELSERFGFVIASDECYSEIYCGHEPPLGSLQAAVALGRTDFKNLMAFTSLSKRSNVPGLRSGFVAGDAQLIKAFLLYRTYHGSAMSPTLQHASIVAWNDETHVIENRQKYREKFQKITPLLARVLEVKTPDAGFYLWAKVPQDDVHFACNLLAQYNVAVLPGSLLAREAHGINPGTGRIRLALVAELPECLDAAQRICAFVQNMSP